MKNKLHRFGHSKILNIVVCSYISESRLCNELLCCVRNLKISLKIFKNYLKITFLKNFFKII